MEGNFGRPPDIAIGTRPGSRDVGDFDNDGYQEVVTGVSSPSINAGTVEKMEMEHSYPAFHLT